MDRAEIVSPVTPCSWGQQQQLRITQGGSWDPGMRRRCDKGAAGATCVLSNQPPDAWSLPRVGSRHRRTVREQQQSSLCDSIEPPARWQQHEQRTCYAYGVGEEACCNTPLDRQGRLQDRWAGEHLDGLLVPVCGCVPHQDSKMIVWPGLLFCCSIMRGGHIRLKFFWTRSQGCVELKSRSRGQYTCAVPVHLCACKAQPGHALPHRPGLPTSTQSCKKALLTATCCSGHNRWRACAVVRPDRPAKMMLLCSGCTPPILPAHPIFKIPHNHSGTHSRNTHASQPTQSQSVADTSSAPPTENRWDGHSKWCGIPCC